LSIRSRTNPGGDTFVIWRMFAIDDESIRDERGSKKNKEIVLDQICIEYEIEVR
jgi:hypothetical protein